MAVEIGVWTEARDGTLIFCERQTEQCQTGAVLELGQRQRRTQRFIGHRAPLGGVRQRESQKVDRSESALAFPVFGRIQTEQTIECAANHGIAAFEWRHKSVLRRAVERRRLKDYALQSGLTSFVHQRRKFAHSLFRSVAIPKERAHFEYESLYFNGINAVAYETEVGCANKHGLSPAAAVMRVTPIGPPTKPHKIWIIQQKAQSVVLGWERVFSDGGSDVIYYNIRGIAVGRRGANCEENCDQRSHEVRPPSDYTKLRSEHWDQYFEGKLSKNDRIHFEFEWPRPLIICEDGQSVLTNEHLQLLDFGLSINMCIE